MRLTAFYAPVCRLSQNGRRQTARRQGINPKNNGRWPKYGKKCVSLQVIWKQCAPRRKKLTLTHITVMQETRQNRIARLLQKELSLIFQSQTRSMHGVMVSVTRCRISPDLSICTAYLSIFPSEKADELIQNITANEKTIRYELGTRVRNQLRIIPELRFFVDDSLDYIAHIDELLKK